MARNKTFQTVAAVLILVAALVAAYFILTYPPAGDGPLPAPTAERAPEAAPTGAPSVRLVTWNLLNFGRSKDARELAVIADLLREYDLVAVQEVSTGPAGAEAVGRLVDLLERRGADWDYTISEPTTGNGAERYAYLWKPSRVTLVGKAWLDNALADPIDREPYLARFEADGRRMLLASFHAVPRDKNPDAEIMLLDGLHRRYTDDHLLVMGDFNLSQQDKAFDRLKAAGYAPVLTGQKTSLRMKRRDSGRPDAHLANEYDNIFFETAPLRADTAGVLDFTGRFATLREARAISDHLPVFMTIRWN